MKVSTMRKVDRCVGMPICLVLTLVRKVNDLFRSIQPSPIRRILFVKPAEQGATVLAYPAIKQAVERVGRENVFFLVFEENRFILDVMGVIPEQNVITIPTDNIFTVVRGVLAAVRKIRKLHIDAAIDCEFFARSSAILTYLSGAAVRVGFHAFFGEASYRGDLMTHRLSYSPFLHANQMFQMMVAALDFPADQLPALNLTAPRIDARLPQFKACEAEIEQFKDVLRQATGCRKVPPLVLLNANCSDLLPLRRWPSENYVELASRLLARYPRIHIAFTGAPAEAHAASRLVGQINSERCTNLAGKTTLRQLLILYTLSEVLVTNDSGPAHFATLTPIDVVTLFGPESPALFAAHNPRNHVFWAGLVCSPCVNAYNDRQSACRNNVCMRRISVDQVFEEVCGILDRRIGLSS